MMGQNIMDSNPVSHVRHSCAAVARQARQVHICHAAIPDYAQSLPFQELQNPEHHPERHYMDGGDATAAFFITLDTINFGSGYFPHLRKRPGMSGYYTLATSLTEYFRQHGPLTAAMLAGITPDQCRIIFQQDAHNPPVTELMQMFAQAWQELGHFLLRRFEGRFTALIEAAENSALRLIALVLEMPCFQDQADYHGQCVCFYKRAQILAADLALAFQGQGWGDFRDLHELTIFADNLVPHVLRLDGILDYAPHLAEQIDQGHLLASGSEAEIEIRATALHAVETICRFLRQKGYSYTAMQLDYLLWRRGQQPEYKQARPRHRTRSLFY